MSLSLSVLPLLIPKRFRSIAYCYRIPALVSHLCLLKALDKALEKVLDTVLNHSWLHQSRTLGKTKVPKVADQSNQSRSSTL